MQELNITLLTLVKIYFNNKIVIYMTRNPFLHDRTKYIEVDKHFIKEKFDINDNCMSCIPTKSQVVDVVDVLP